MAEDEDVAINAAIEFYCEGLLCEDFFIDSQSGMISTGSSLDYENVPEYSGIIEVCSLVHT